MTTDGYRERLRCPWSWYVTGALAGLVLAPEISFVTPLPIWSTMLAGVVAAIVIVTWIGRSTLAVEDGVLLVAGAKLPVRYVGGVVALEAPTMRRLMGRDGDPAAFLATKPWVGPGVQIVLDDPEDPVPYWAVSTRHPRELTDALNRARTLEETRQRD
ncbi:DUF3093 domain-containing protein [Jatrophihabitans sp. YIM 134969]